jgi:glycosyltransferase involved in cell wall biosynthesis
MRLGLITPGFSADEKDWSIPILQTLFTALARSHHVRVFALRYPPGPRSYSFGGFPVHAVGGAGASGLARGPALLRSLRAILVEARREPFDLLHAFWADEPGFSAVTAGRLLRVPTLVSLMGGELVGLPELEYGGRLSRLNPLLVNVAVRGADRISVGSAAMQRLLAERYPGLNGQRLAWGVDTRLFSPVGDSLTASPLEGGTFKILQVASLSPVKDHRTALRAMTRIAAEESGTHLHLVGGGPAAGDLRDRVASRGLGGHVTLHGAVGHPSMPDYYRASDVCLVTSRHEAQCMAALEAAACGRSTVGTAVGLLPELAPACVSVPVGDWQALADAVLALARDRGRLQRAGRAARELAVREYSLDGCLESLTALYRTLAGRD